MPQTVRRLLRPNARPTDASSLAGNKPRRIKKSFPEWTSNPQVDRAPPCNHTDGRCQLAPRPSVRHSTNLRPHPVGDRIRLSGGPNTMSKGFIYVVATVGRSYQQTSVTNVPSWHDDRLYFGACKVTMRPKMQQGDYVFGVSPSGTNPRRIVFAARIAERVSFRDAYFRWPALRGPDGPIHVRPVDRPGLLFPLREYEHIPGAMHAATWKRDLPTPRHDVFLAFEPAGDCLGRWFGPAGPAVDRDVLAFLQQCAVFGSSGLLSEQNSHATPEAPIRHGNLFTGLHLETNAAESLLNLCCRELRSSPLASTRNASPVKVRVGKVPGGTPRRARC
jgi:hypothetical protein